MTIDRDALFAALALKERRVDADRLGRAYGAWQKSTRPLAEVMVREGWITPEDRAALQQRVHDLLHEYQQDAHSLWNAAADEQAKSVMTELGIPPFQPTEAPDDLSATVDQPPSGLEATRGGDPGETTGPGPAAEGGQGSLDATAAGFQPTIDSQAGHRTAETAISSALPLESRFVDLERLGAASGSQATTLRYNRTKLHAQGGLGRIWRARDTVIGRDVALKELRPEQVNNAAVVDRFLSEARVTGQLEHPNIVPVHELARQFEDGRPFYTMRFVRGRTLGEAIAAYHARKTEGTADALELRALLDAFLAVCNAVAYAHSRGVIHRDLKGLNVVLGDFGEVMVLDWGLAKAVDLPEPEAGPTSDTSEQGTAVLENAEDAEPEIDLADADTRAGQVLGTPAYMSPEQATGRLEEIGPLSDIYSLGAILFEILTGRPPFVGSRTAELLLRVRDEEAPEPRSIDPNIPKPLDAVCRKALNKAPDDRYPSAEALADEIRRWLADEPVQAYREPWTIRAARWARRHKTAVAAAAALIAAALPILAVSNLLIGRERDRTAQMADVAREAVEDMYVEVADTWLENVSDPRQEAFLQRALARYEGPLAVGADGAEPLEPADDRRPAPEQAAILREALDYYEHLSEHARADRLDRGHALARIGDIQGKLGRLDRAEQFYRRALEALAPLNDAPAAARRARVEARLGALLTTSGRYDEAEAFLLSAIEVFESEPVDAPEKALELVQAERELAELLKVTERLDEARIRFKSAVERLEPLAEGRPEDPNVANALATALDGFGVLKLILDDEAGAERLLSRAVEVQRPLLKRHPTVPRYREALAKSLNSLGLIARRRGEANAAEAALRESLAHYQRLSGDFPDRYSYQRSLARASSNLGLLLQDRSDLAGAREAFQTAAEADAALAERYPDVPRIRRDLVFVRNNLGAVLMRLGDLKAARDAFDQAVRLGASLVEDHPDIPFYRQGLATALLNRGRAARRSGELPASEADLTRAIELYDQLVEHETKRPEVLQERAACLAEFGLTLVRAGEEERGRDALRNAIASYEQALARAPEDDDLRRGLASTLSNLGERGPEDAEALLNRAAGLFAALVEERPDEPELIEREGIARYNLGERLALNGRPEAAEASYAEAFTLFRQETALVDRATPHFFAALAAFDRGRLLIELDRAPEAVETLRQGLDGIQAAVTRRPGAAAFEAVLVDVHEALVDALIATGDIDGAALTASKLADASAGRPELRARAAALLARCVEAADPARAESFAQSAIAQLRVAIDAGYELEPPQADAFEPIKDRPEFQALLPKGQTADRSSETQ